jgi:alkylhydroperoxidase family enzyme
MPRIAYANEDTSPDIRTLAEQVRAERGGKVGDLYRMLLNSPPVCRGWLNFLTAIRQQCKLSGRYREMTIIRVAVVNGADHEKKSHIPFALKEGMTEAQVEALSDWQGSSLFNEADRAVLAYADAMTKDIQVPDAVFATVRKHFDDRELTELTATIAAYNLVSRFLVALHVGH